MLQAISHIALVVTDAKKTALLFEDLFAAKVVQRIDADGHDEVFMKLGDTWFMLAQAAIESGRSGDHIAFRVSKEVLASTLEKLKSRRMEYILARSDTSLYFYDYDNHVFELDTTDFEASLNLGATQR